MPGSMLLIQLMKDLLLNTLKIHFEVCKAKNIYSLGKFRDKVVGITGTA